MDNDTNLDENGQPIPVSNTIIPPDLNLSLPSRRQQRPEIKPPPKPKEKEQVGKKKQQRGWKQQAGGGFDHQFFDNARLDELEAKENLWDKFQANPEEWTKDGKEPPPEYTKEDGEEF